MGQYSATCGAEAGGPYAYQSKLKNKKKIFIFLYTFIHVTIVSHQMYPRFLYRRRRIENWREPSLILSNFMADVI